MDDTLCGGTGVDTRNVGHYSISNYNLRTALCRIDARPEIYGIEMWSAKNRKELFQGTAVRLIERS